MVREGYKETELGEIPEEWNIGYLGSDIGYIISGSTPSTYDKKFWDGNIVWITPDDLSSVSKKISESKRKITNLGANSITSGLIPANSIVISSRAPIGYVAICSVPFTTNQGCKSIVVKKEFDTEFFYYQIVFNVNQIKKRGYGTTFLEIPKTQLELINLVYPNDLYEQHRIATVLSTLDECIEKTEALIAKLKQVKAGLMQDLLTRGIDSEGRIRDESTHEFKDTEIGRVPVEWKVKSCNTICEQISVGVVIKPASYYTENGVPALRSLNINEDNFNLDNLVYFTEKDNSGVLAKSKLRERDIVVVRTGNPGIAAVISKELDGINCIDLLFLRVTKDIINQYFLSKYFNSSMGKMEIANHLTGLAQQHLNVSAIQKTNIPIPSIREQNRIISILTSLDDRINLEEAYLDKLLSMKKGLMGDLLTGRIRVPEGIREI